MVVNDKDVYKNVNVPSHIQIIRKNNSRSQMKLLYLIVAQYHMFRP
jgi:hypothetical protein